MENNFDRFCLGTAQFSGKYGITRSTDIINDSEIEDLEGQEGEGLLPSLDLNEYMPFFEAVSFFCEFSHALQAVSETVPKVP